MDVSPRIAEQIEKLPPELRALFDAEIAAGNDVISVEFGRGPDAGKVALILNHPFRTSRRNAPADVLYRERLDQDPHVFEFHTADEKFSLVTAKFKPMKLQKLGPGPENPTEKHIAAMKKREEELAAIAKQRAIDAKNSRRANEADVEIVHQPSIVPPPQSAPERYDDPRLGEAANKFLASMNITYEMWHDGIGYDIESLRAAPAGEQAAIEKVLIERRPRDWRDVEALAALDSSTAKAAVVASLKDRDPLVRREAMEHAADAIDPRQREDALVRSLESDVIYSGLGASIDEAVEFHPPAVVDALFRGALRRDGEAAVHFAALLFYLHGKAKEPFDWEHRPFFLKFHAKDRKEREALFRELCRIVGVDAKKYLQ